MKVVASSRLPAAQAKAEAVGPVFRGMHSVFEPVVEMLKGITFVLQLFGLIVLAKADVKTLLVVICTDKGLCGSTNNNMTRTLLKQDLSQNSIIVWGEKGGPAFEVTATHTRLVPSSSF